MSEASVTEARALVCSALADIGGVCERLREIESSQHDADAWSDVEAWVTQACETLGLVTSIAAEEMSSVGLLEGHPCAGRHGDYEADDVGPEWDDELADGREE